MPSDTKGGDVLEAARLAGAVALVTGGSRGIGRAIAIELASLGASVAICGRDERSLRDSEGALRAAGGAGVRMAAVKADVTQEGQVETLASTVAGSLGAITILVNNAGIGLFGPAHEKSPADWDLVIATNLKSVFLMSKAVVPAMIRRGGGDIINISSLAGKNTFAGGGIYCASKWGVQGLSGCMAEDLRGYGIRVSVICPGTVATEFSGSGRGSKDPAKMLQAEDVAHAVAMVAVQGPTSFISEVQMRPVKKP